MNLYIGIDNGVTGSIGFVGTEYDNFVLTPTIKEQSYTKAKNLITRVDVVALKKLLEDTMQSAKVSSNECMVIMERPLINPTMFKASISASRALEATLGIVEQLELPHIYVDSKQWQREMLPKGTTGTPELKKASKDIAERLYPRHKKIIDKHKDAAGLLIARWGKQNSL